MGKHLIIDTEPYVLSDGEEQQVARLAEQWVDDHYEQMWEYARQHLGGKLSGVPGPFDALLREIAMRFSIETNNELDIRRVKFFAHFDEARGPQAAKDAASWASLSMALRTGDLP
ncbi:hypothetical protein [[Mycobacterium] zoologicum]|uniref:hypothetical protein n=1 Tax=[Mycobacterium] zoologicum TaxID=2872311 RepID=UPI001CDA8D97|nr:hypothetical protein [Mycolicibacter sp. MYC101]MEB3065400.1 hypothetical protein [Mycolicibacter sp. MYC101]